MPILPPLDPEAIIRKMDAVLAAYPRASLRRSSNIEEMMGYGLSSDTIDRYLKKYEEFKQGAARYFERLHTLVRRAALVVDVPYKISNESGVAAKGLRIETRLEGDAWIADDRADAYRQIGIPPLPGPPKPPSPHDGLRISPHLFNNFGSPPEPRDPTGFYWADRPEVGDKAASLMCEDYHPRRSWDDSALIVTNEVTFVGALRFHVIASNLPEPINATLAVRLIEREATWDDPAIVEMLRGIVTIEDD